MVKIQGRGEVHLHPPPPSFPMHLFGVTRLYFLTEPLLEFRVAKLELNVFYLNTALNNSILFFIKFSILSPGLDAADLII